MESRQGLTQRQAVALLDLARQKGKPCVVKIINKEVRNRPGRGILKSVLNNEKVTVRPFKHGHDEEELLSNIFFWPGGMGFEFEEVVNMAGVDYKKPLGERLSIPMSVVPTGDPVTEYVIFSAKMKAVWGGQERRWTQNFNFAHKWKDNHGDSSRSLYRIKQSPTQNDAVLMPAEEAHEALLELLTAPVKTVQPAPVMPRVDVLPFKPQTVAQKDIRNTAPASSPPALAAAKPKPSVQAVFSNDDDEIDFDILLGKDEASLRLAKEERMKTADEYGKAKKAAREAVLAADEAFAKLKELDLRVLSLGGLASLKETQIATPPEKKPRAKRVVMFPAVKDILMTHSRLNVGAIYEKLVIVLPEADRSKLSKNLSNYKEAGLVELDDNGGWALTPEGRLKQGTKED